MSIFFRGLDNVPRSEDAAEDDGWIMAYVYDAKKDSSGVVIFNAA